MPKISMIVTTFNRGAWLYASLFRLSSLTHPDEIIVVDDGSDDGTRGIVEQYKDLPIVYVRNERPQWGNRSLPTNIGVRLANFEYLLCTDPEVMFLTDVVAQFAAAVEQFPDRILAPWNGYHDVKPRCQLSECFLARPGNGLHDNGGNAFLYKRSWVEEIGGLDESLEPGAWDDIDFHTRLAWKGHTQVAVPGVDIRHVWHDLIPWNAGDPAFTDSSLRNKARVEAKQYPRDLVANVGREWGTIL